MRRDRVVFWLGEPSPHQSGYLVALPRLLPRASVVAVFQRPLQDERLALGWDSPALAGVEVVMRPGRRTLEAIAARAPERSVHVFGGMRLPMIREALAACAGTPALVGVVSEARRPDGWRGALRVLHSRVVERPHRHRVGFVLAIGAAAAGWYERCGYARERIFAWAYVAERPPAPVRASRSPPRGCLAISYVGRCIPGKGVDLLLAALARADLPEWRLRIVGDGPQMRSLQGLARRLRIDDRVSFLGARSNTDVWDLLAASDVLVLPSGIDGWGAVANEALMSGTPVICSDYCGASDLIRDGDCGRTFRAGSIADLAAALSAWAARGPTTHARRRRIREWSRRIDGASLASYFTAIVEHVDEGAPKPVAPWHLREPSRPRRDAPAVCG